MSEITGTMPATGGPSNSNRIGHAAAAAHRLAHGVRLPAPMRSQLVILLACLLPALWLMAAAFLHHIHTRILDDATAAAANRVKVLAEETQAEVQAIDRTLFDLRERWQEEPHNFGAKLRLRQAQFEHLDFSISILDADGRSLFDSAARPESGGAGAALQEALAQLRQGGVDTLYIAEAAGENGPGQQPVRFVRPLVSEGRFGGVIVLSVAAEQFLRVSSKTEPGYGTVTLLVRAGGMVLARTPDDGQRHVLSNVPYARPGAAASGVFQAVSQIDGIDRLYAWHTLPGYGLTMSVGTAVTDLLVPYYFVRQAALWGSAFASLLLAWIGYVVVQRLHARELARSMREQSEFRWRAALEGSGHVVWDLDFGTGMGLLSPGSMALFGCEEPAAGGVQDWIKLVHRCDRERALAALRDCRRGASPTYAVEYRIVTGAGATRWILSRGMVVGSGAPGKPLRMIGTHADITERKEAEALAREAQAAENLFRSERRFRQLADAMPQIVWTAEPDGTVDYGNQMLADYSGLTCLRERDAWCQVVHAEDVARTVAAWGTAVQGGTIFETECRIFRVADGSYRWHQVRGLPIADEHGAIVKWYGAATDIHDSKLANDEIRRLANSLSTNLESITNAYYALDTEWRFTYVNKETERLLKRSRESLLGKVVWDEYPELRGGIAEREYQWALSSGSTTSFELFHPPTNYWFAVRVYPSSQGVMVYFEDVTERRRLCLFKDEQTGILERIAAGAPLADILRAATRIVAEADPLSACAVMLLGEDGQHLQHAVSCNLPPALETALGRVAIGAAALPGGRAAAERRPVIAPDLAAEAAWRAAGGAACAPEIRACRSYPILAADGAVFGTFDVYTASQHAPTQVELEILGSCAHTLSIAIGRERNEQKAKQYQAELEYQADYDAESGLASRNLLVGRIGTAVAQGAPAWVACINLRRFRLVNETLGHSAADVVLRLLAHRVQGVLGAHDLAARVGWDEIVLLFADGNDEHSVVTKVQRIMEAIALPLPVHGHDYFLSSNAGISAFPADGDDADTLMRNAHIAMRRAKEVRSNSLEFFTATMNDRALERMRLECDLRHALQREELVLHYQPQVDARTGRIVGMEALLRWQHPQLGLLAPDRFIRIAEETGLIVAIGAWVMRSACAQARQWQSRGQGQLRVAVNLAASQLYYADLSEMVSSTLRATGLAPHCLEIELTESQVIADVEHALCVMQRLKAIGVKLSLDDFGTGYSSLSYLQRFPIDVLKIDKSFVQNLASDPDQAVIARSIITLGQSLQLEVVAEGVETEEQLAYLRRHRCDRIQGYYFSRPLPAPEFERLLCEDKASLPPEDSNPDQPTILIVDDDDNVLSALQRLLRRDGYRILRGKSGPEGLALLALHEVQVVLSDERMPGMSGTDFLARVKTMYPDTIRIMLSGYTAVDAVIAATNSGAVFRFHAKPWDDDALRDSIAEAFRYQWLMRRGASPALAA